METGFCSRAAAEYIRRRHTLARIGSAILPFGAEFLYLNRILAAHRRHHVLVLCYHGVVPDEIAEDPQRYGNLMGVSEFSEQMSLLARTMAPISLPALEGWLFGDSALRDNSVLITLDDGYRNNLAHAAGILLRFGIPVVIFPTVGYIGTDRLLWPTEVYRSILLWPSPQVPLPDGSAIVIPPNNLRKRTALAEWVREYCKTIPDELKDTYLQSLRETALPDLTPSEVEMFRFLSWEEIYQLHRMGFTIGSHTMNHCILTRIRAERLRRELEESKQQVERHLRSTCVALAYPNGGTADYSPHIVSNAKQVGYKIGFTTNEGTCTRQTDPLAVNRICIPGKLSRFGYQTRIGGLHSLLRSSLHYISRNRGHWPPPG